MNAVMECRWNVYIVQSRWTIQERIEFRVVAWSNVKITSIALHQRALHLTTTNCETYWKVYRIVENVEKITEFAFANDAAGNQKSIHQMCVLLNATENITQHKCTTKISINHFFCLLPSSFASLMCFSVVTGRANHAQLMDH